MKTRFIIDVPTGTIARTIEGVEVPAEKVGYFVARDTLEAEVVLMVDKVNVTTQLLDGCRLLLGLRRTLSTGQLLARSTEAVIESNVAKCRLNLATPQALELLQSVSGNFAGVWLEFMVLDEEGGLRSRIAQKLCQLWGEVIMEGDEREIATPTITSQPNGGRFSLGSAFSLSVSADGTRPLYYQWFKNGNSIPGETHATLSIAVASDDDAGLYRVHVSNFAGAAVSDEVEVIVGAGPAITSQPTGGDYLNGDDITLMVTASGEGLSYQWKKNGTSISGATSPTLSIPSAGFDDSGSYTVVVSNPYGSVVSSSAAVTVNSAPSITVQPTGSTLGAGEALNISVTAIGTSPLTYQWKKNGTNIPGATSSSFSIGAVVSGDAADYTVTVSNGFGTVTSDVAHVSVLTPSIPSITSQPSDLSAAVGGPALFTVVATGYPAPTYQWKKNGVNIPGATNSTLNIANVLFSDAGNYTVVVTNSQGSVTSTAAVLTALGNYEAEVRADLPLFYLKGDSLNDSLGTGFNGSGTGITYDSGPTGILGSSAIVCDGSTSIATFPPLARHGPFPRTIEFWTYRTSNTAVRCLFYAGTHSGNNSWYGSIYSVYTNVNANGDVYASFHGQDIYTPGNALPLNTWCHVVIVYNGGYLDELTGPNASVKIYVNNVLKSVSAVGGRHVRAHFCYGSNVVAAAPVYLSNDPATAGRSYTGKISNLALYEYALPASRISTHYAAGTATSYTPKINNTGTLQYHQRGKSEVRITYSGVTGAVGAVSHQLQRADLSDGTFTNIGSPVVGATADFLDTTGTPTPYTFPVYRVISTDSASTVFTSSELPVPILPDGVVAMKNMGFGVSFHYALWPWFDINGGTVSNPDAAAADASVNTFSPTAQDIDQWLDAAQAAGAKYVFYTVKHHQGYCFWDTATTSFKVTNSAWYLADPTNRNMNEQFHAKALARGLKVGIYFSIWDIHFEHTHPGYTPADYRAMVTAQLTELLTNFGAVHFIITDAWLWHMGYIDWVRPSDVRAVIAATQPGCLLIDNGGLKFSVINDGMDSVSYEQSNVPTPIPNWPWMEVAWPTGQSDGAYAYWKGSDVAGHLVSAIGEARAITPTSNIVSTIAAIRANGMVCTFNVFPDETGLLPNYQVAQLKAIGGNDSTPPAVPTGLGGTRVSSTAVDLSWTNNTETDLSHYRVYGSADGGSTWTLLAKVYSYVTSPTNTKSLTGLSIAMTKFRLSAVDFAQNESALGATLTL